MRRNKGNARGGTVQTLEPTVLSGHVSGRQGWETHTLPSGRFCVCLDSYTCTRSSTYLHTRVYVTEVDTAACSTTAPTYRRQRSAQISVWTCCVSRSTRRCRGQTCPTIPTPRTSKIDILLHLRVEICMFASPLHVLRGTPYLL